MPVTVRRAQESGLEGLIADVCDLSVLEVLDVLAGSRGNTHLATAFAGTWPAQPDELARLTLSKALRLGLEREIAAIVGIDAADVTFEMEIRSGNMHVATAFADYWPEPEVEEDIDDWDDDEESEDEDSDVDDNGDDEAAVPLAFTPFAEEFAYSDDARNRQLRPYQAEAAEQVTAALDPAAPQLLHLPTGAGKTFTANMIVEQWQSQNDKAVLWIAPSWLLLRQAAGDVHRRRRNPGLFRAGGDPEPAIRELAPAPAAAGARRGSIIYTTTYTAQQRLQSGLFVGVGLVVWDECHWGEHAGAARIITRCKRGRVPLLGLTATPHTNTNYAIAYSKTFAELVPAWLARPVLHNAHTGVAWTPDSLRNGDFPPKSLDELACSSQRNKFIVEYYQGNFAHCRKTLVFAVNVAHANELGERFKRAGFAVQVVHSGNDVATNDAVRRAFVAGEVNVLINVAMMTHGVDIPDIETVFLCRPTASDILFSQMVGRGARKTNTKEHFNVVDFVDNLTRHAGSIVRPQRFFQGAGFGNMDSTARGPSPAPHRFDPTGAAAWLVPGPSVPAAAAGLWYRNGQTFGIEFEITDVGGVPAVDSLRWREVAAALVAELRLALPNRVATQPIARYAGIESSHGKDHSVWNVEHDGSAGWEVTTRVLEGRGGLVEVAAACDAMERVRGRFGLDINYRTGVHVHLGWRPTDVEELKRLVRLVRLFEPGLGTLVGPSRLVNFDGEVYNFDNPNEYCKPLATRMTETDLANADAIEDMQALVEDYDTRYTSLNLRPLFLQQATVEIRMHSGSLEAPKVLLWVSLWQQILWAAGQEVDVPPVPDVERILPTGDIVGLAKRFLADAGQPQQQELLAKLAARRAQVANIWANSEQLQHWCDFAAGWRQGESLLAQARAARSRRSLGADSDGHWNDLVSLIDGLDLAGVVRQARFRDPSLPANGHSVIECLMPSGEHEPLVHVWRSAPLKVWVYNSHPGDDLGKGDSSYVEFAASRPGWLSHVARAAIGRYSMRVASSVTIVESA